MKKLIIAFVALISMSVVSAQTAEVPYAVKSSFKSKFNSTQVTWSVDQAYYVAKWNDGGSAMTAYYAKSEEVTLVRTEKDVALADLSSGTQSSVNSRFLTANSQYTLQRSFKVENDANAIEGCEFKMNSGGNIRIYFDATGNMVKRELN